ncbi:MAG: hypothetical protein AB1540_02490 [Bdellovibrionota bacterium]
MKVQMRAILGFVIVGLFCATQVSYAYFGGSSRTKKKFELRGTFEPKVADVVTKQPPDTAERILVTRKEDSNYFAMVDFLKREYLYGEQFRLKMRSLPEKDQVYFVMLADDLAKLFPIKEAEAILFKEIEKNARSEERSFSPDLASCVENDPTEDGTTLGLKLIQQVQATSDSEGLLDRLVDAYARHFDRDPSAQQVRIEALKHICKSEYAAAATEKKTPSASSCQIFGDAVLKQCPKELNLGFISVDEITNATKAIKYLRVKKPRTPGSAVDLSER